MILHNPARSIGRIAFVSQEIASCGARRIEGAKFTCKGSLVSCPECRAVVMDARAKAKATFAAVLAGGAA